MAGAQKKKVLAVGDNKRKRISKNVGVASEQKELRAKVFLQKKLGGGREEAERDK